MKTELQEKLFLKYSNLFDDKKESPIKYYGIECGDGWYSLLDNLLSKIQELNIPEEFYVEQIKEKFGTLRFYVSYTDDNINTLIREAEFESEKICAICGKEGSIKKDGFGWIVCRCDECSVKEF